MTGSHSYPQTYSFTHALTRRPGPEIVDGLRAMDTGTPDLDLFRAHHDDYVAALRETGAEVTVLPALPGFPDAVFIEDAALCLPEGAVVMRPGAASRRGETPSIAEALRDNYDRVLEIEGPGFIEGGDILVIERDILVGKSDRTDAAGVAELTDRLRPWGYGVRELQTPPDVLHFKTDCSVLDDKTVLATERLARTGCFEGYEVVLTAPGEEAAANSIRFNDLVLMPEGFPETAARVNDAGYRVRQIGNSEAAKLDGGMSCLSLRFSPMG
ncbi:MAG: arginine deiminase family protein [Alphaproteobacteria bacterium]|nr:arginine deiminase family protein [Alphaproteobacteria bacterium]